MDVSQELPPSPERAALRFNEPSVAERRQILLGRRVAAH